ncbi:MAG: DeoR/GlpR family DNA-binding transcription regulator [Pseudomonadota bacterium]
MQVYAMLDLNNPDTRQDIIQGRLDPSKPLVATALARELEISVDTVRRDLIALEAKGVVRRVRGGAIPIAAHAQPYEVRAQQPDAATGPLGEYAARMIPRDATVFLDAGTTMNAVARHLAGDFCGLIITPAPSVALAALSRGAKVELVGGSLCPEGAMAVGSDAERAVEAYCADLCFLGACGLWPEFGLSAEDSGERGVKRAMALASARVVVVTSAAKMVRAGRHRVLALNEINTLVTDAPIEQLTSFAEAGVELCCV